jgi:hypothetical protein
LGQLVFLKIALKTHRYLNDALPMPVRIISDAKELLKADMLTYTYHCTLLRATRNVFLRSTSLPPGSAGSPPTLPLDNDYTTHAHADNISSFAHRIYVMGRSHLSFDTSLPAFLVFGTQRSARLQRRPNPTVSIDHRLIAKHAALDTISRSTVSICVRRTDC